jgi:hypothetical protein
LYITILVIYKEVRMAIKVEEAKKLKVQDKPATVKNERLPPCDKPHVAEASRNEEADEACDDGVR